MWCKSNFENGNILKSVWQDDIVYVNKTYKKRRLFSLFAFGECRHK